MSHFLKFAWVALSVPLYAQTTFLTEHEAVRRALAMPTITSLNAARIDLARSDVFREAAWPNPTFDYLEEPQSERTFAVSQSFDLSGRRGLRRRAAELRLSAATAEVERARILLAREVQLSFARATADQRLVVALSEWLGRVTAVTEIVGRLEKAGEASGYDRRRLERERLSAAARLGSERAALGLELRRLSALTGTDTSAATLEPAAFTIPGADAVRARIEQRPDIVALQQRAEAAGLEQRAAQRWQFPIVDLTAGTKELPTTTGSVVGAAVALPVLNRNRAEIRRAAAEARIAAAERDILLIRVRAEAEGLLAEAQALADAAQEFRAQALPTSERLAATAQAAYQAGEIGILELLDAYRTAVEAETLATELELRARESVIELRTTIGGTQP